MQTPLRLNWVAAAPRNGALLININCNSFIFPFSKPSRTGASVANRPHAPLAPPPSLLLLSALPPGPALGCSLLVTSPPSQIPA